MHHNKGSKKKHAPSPGAGSPAAAPAAAGSARLLQLARFLLVAAFGISVYLAYSSFTSSAIAGCGINSDCHTVLNSKWAYLAGVPVSVPAAILYVVVFLSTFQIKAGRGGSPAFVILAGASAIIAAAVWFSIIQLFILKRICPYCMGAHLAGAVASILLMCEGRRSGWFGEKPMLARAIMGVAAVVALLLLQVAAPEKQTFGQTQYGATNSVASSVSNQPSNGVAANATQAVQPTNPAPVAAVAPTNPAPLVSPQTTAVAAQSGPNYLLPIIQGAFTLDLRKLPVEGSLDAPHKMVKLFDFTCYHCRDLHHLIDKARATFSNQLAVVMLPVPLDANCNSLIKRTPPPHANACEYANIGLAVGRAAPHKFAEFSRWVFAPARPPSVQDTRAYAAQLAGSENLERELAGQASYEQVQKNIEIYTANSNKGKSSNLPQLIFPNGASFGSIKKLDDVYNLLNQHYGLSTNQ